MTILIVVQVFLIVILAGYTWYMIKMHIVITKNLSKERNEILTQIRNLLSVDQDVRDSIGDNIAKIGRLVRDITKKDN